MEAKLFFNIFDNFLNFTILSIIMNKFSLNQIFKKDFDLYNLKDLFNCFFIIFLPNSIFYIFSISISISRPIVNIDYFIAFIFILLPYKLLRIFGGVVLVFAIFFDVLMLLIQIFPFMEISSLIYLSSFIFTAPAFYLLVSLCCIVVCVFICVFIFSFTKKNLFKQPFTTFFLLFLLMLSYIIITLNISLSQFYGILGRGNSYIAHSQALLYREITKSNFVNFMNTTPEFLPLEESQQKVSSGLNIPYSPKILFIVAESWGVLRNSVAQDYILQKVYRNKNNFDFIFSGEISASGATVEGELRELCGLGLRNKGFALSRVENNVFDNCLPNQLKQKNYMTMALHGTSGLLYDRTDWYIKAGFQQALFGEHFLDLRRCTAFKGVCDTQLMDEVAKSFQKYGREKLFFYWMTLTSHQPYAKQDIYNQRFDCKKFAMNPTGDACHNAQLQTQFFDDLAQLIQKPEMKGVEVIVVGDHQPPVWGEEEVSKIKPLKVGYLHFKIK